MDLSKLNWKGILGGIVAAIIGLVLLPNLVISVGAGEIVVVQSPLTGSLTVYSEPGPAWQGLGHYQRYKRREQFSFSSQADIDNAKDQAIITRFNDGGHGAISGVISWEMPIAQASVIRLHKEFGSIAAIEQQLIRPSLEKVIYNVGPTMSTTESSAERRPEIPQYIDDQMQNGPYATKTVVQEVPDPIDPKIIKKQNVVVIERDESGKAKRTAPSTIKEYQISLFPVSINTIKYDDTVEKQIGERQRAIINVQIRQAAAKSAEQDAITQAKEGEAKAAKAKWEQETINAKDIAAAERDKAIATLNASAAEQYKREQILRGEGDAERKRLVMAADGALDAKLEALKEINSKYATAIEKAQPGAWTPSVVMGGGAQTNGATALVELMMAKTARDLGVDLSTAGKGNTAKK